MSGADQPGTDPLAPVEILAERDGDGPGVHSLDRFVIQVPDLAEAQRFYTLFGLDVRPSGRSLELATFGDPHVWGTVVEGAKKATHHLSFGIYGEDRQAFEKRLAERGVVRVDSPRGFESDGIWIRGFDDILMELRVAEKSSPDAPVTARPGAPREPRGTELGRISARPVQPSRLAHCLMFTSDTVGAISFYRDVLGMRLSDRAGNVVAFMHGVHGSDHHMVAFAQSSAPGFHHCSWHVDGIEEIGRGAMLMAEAGFDKGWGLGRHVIGSNYFHYVQDPWGSFSEYSYDIDYVPRGHQWDTRDFSMRDALAIWGPAPPEDFVHNYEAD